MKKTFTGKMIDERLVWRPQHELNERLAPKIILGADYNAINYPLGNQKIPWSRLLIIDYGPSMSWEVDDYADEEFLFD